MKRIILLLFTLTFQISCYSQETLAMEVKDTLVAPKVSISENEVIEKPGIKPVNIFFNDEMLVLSNYVKKSRVSVFIASATYCKPCHTLLAKLKRDIVKDKNFSKVDLYIINAPDPTDSSQLVAYNSYGYQFFRDIDNFPMLTLPTIYIYSPTRNIFLKSTETSDYNLILKSILKLAYFCK
jgi:hypothetical protein